MYLNESIEKKLLNENLCERFNVLLSEFEQRLNDSLDIKLQALETNVTTKFKEKLTSVERRLDERLITENSKLEVYYGKIINQKPYMENQKPQMLK